MAPNSRLVPGTRFLTGAARIKLFITRSQKGAGGHIQTKRALAGGVGPGSDKFLGQIDYDRRDVLLVPG